MIKLKYAYIAFIVSFFLISCEKDINEKYLRPEWLAGKVFTLIEANDTLSTFAQCLKIVGYDTIINTSGSYTVFAPTNEAFAEYLQKNNYASVKDIPVEKLTRLVKYHLVQNPWSKKQLRSLDLYGWIDTLDLNNNVPKGYKRLTLLRDINRKYGIGTYNYQYFYNYSQPYIIDTLNTSLHRRVITDSRKYAPIFYSEYFSAYKYNSSDFEFYFNRPFTGGDDIYFANGKIIGNEIFAENGFIYKIDQVVEPLKNGYQILDEKSGSHNYSKYLDLVNHFSYFYYSDIATKNQSGANQGLVVDSLFYLFYPWLVFNINNEIATPPNDINNLPNNVTIRYHHGLLAPTNEAFDKLINDYINVPQGWGNFENTPFNVRRIIANTHMSYNPVYLTDIKKGVFNGEEDIVNLDQSAIVDKRYGSNCTFIGLDKPIVPKAFSSITGPIYLRPGYSTVMFTIESAGLLAALKRPNKNYSFFVESDQKLLKDSSLFIDPFNGRFYIFQLNKSTGAKKYTLSRTDLRTLLLNHVAINQPKGIASKEFIPNLAGNYIVFNNKTGEVSGTANTTEGFQGTDVAPNFPQQISVNADNGKTYEINNWFNFAVSSVYSNIQLLHPAFFSLMKSAGLVNEREYKFPFLSDDEFYTVFAPSVEALKNFDASKYTQTELANIIKMHFVQGKLIFTDGSSNSGYYSTTRLDEKSTTYSTIFTQIFIGTGTDLIKINKKDGSAYTQIIESEKSNILSGISIPTSNNEVLMFPNTYNNAVMHQIDKVLLYNEVDTK